MKKMIVVLSILLVSVIAKGEENCFWVKFKPEKIFNRRFVFLYGKLDNGKYVSFYLGLIQCGKFFLLTEDYGKVDEINHVWFDDNDCTCINDIKKYGYVTWYKIKVLRWISRDEPLAQKNFGKYAIPTSKFTVIHSLSYYDRRTGKKVEAKKNDYNTFMYIPPISKNELEHQ